jgi:hypothetical protein
MALVIADRVRETTTTSGTGTISLSGPYSGFQAFSVIGNGNTTYYAIIDAQNGAWEVGIGAYTSSGNTLSRATVLASSNAGSLVNFGTGTKDVILTQPARRSVLVQEGGSGLITGVAAFTANGVPYADSTSTLTTGSALTFDGNTFTAKGAATSGTAVDTALFTGGVVGTAGSGAKVYLSDGGAARSTYISGFSLDGTTNAHALSFGVSAAYAAPTEGMRLTSTGLGIGTSSPVGKLDVVTSGSGLVRMRSSTGAGTVGFQAQNSDTGTTTTDGFFVGIDGSEQAYVYNYENSPLLFGTNNAERMRLDSSGNLGLGVTPSGWGTYKAVQIATASLWGAAYNAYVGANYYFDGTNRKYISSAFATEYAQVDGQHRWYTAPSGTAGNAISFTQAMTLDASGNLGIGTTSPNNYANYKTLSIFGTNGGEIDMGDGTTTRLNFYTTSSSVVLNAVGAIPLAFGTNGSERARIDSSGNFTIGGQAATRLEVNLTENDKVELNAVDSTNTARNLVFSTGDAERARIDTSGNLLVGKTSTSLTTNGIISSGTTDDAYFVVTSTIASGGSPANINRQSSDGTLIDFRQANTSEGNISVSGSTVSYNGGHLSRWAQMLTKPDLLKGTVMSNLDEMNVYIAPTTYWTEEDELPEGVNVGDVKVETHEVQNEQLNKVKVSDVEGDANVAGVFVNWEHDDAHDVDEINMAMTGDMIIRIAQGVTVARGDLLMSAGDGTAKPQGDDIVRSKTVAKVTSTHVTCTYADGSFCVPCVLMAC